jgi:hypothetical protein
VKQPFTGGSVSKSQFSKPEQIERPDYCLPYNMLVVPHGMKQPSQTTHSTEFYAKRATKHTQ